MFRISQNGQEPIVDVDSIEQIEPVIRSSPPGRYHVDEISADPLPSRHTSRRWGLAIRHPHGSVDLDPDPREARRPLARRLVS